MTALRRAIRILRYVNETLVLVLQALFPLLTHNDPARRQTRPQKGMPTSPPSWNTAALAVVILALGRMARSFTRAPPVNALAGPPDPSPPVSRR